MPYQGTEPTRLGTAGFLRWYLAINDYTQVPTDVKTRALRGLPLISDDVARRNSEFRFPAELSIPALPIELGDVG